MKYTWWILQVGGMLVSGFFFLFGIDLMTGSYSLKDPYSFIMTFFAASFVLLISLTLMISFIIKMIRVYRQIKHNANHKTQPSDKTKNINEQS